MDEQHRQLCRLTETYLALEEFAELLSTQDTCGITHQSAAFLNVGLESIDRQLGLTHNLTPYGVRQRHQTTAIGLETFTDRIQNVLEQIKLLIGRIVHEAKTLLDRLLSGVDNTEAHTTYLLENLKQFPTTPGGGKVRTIGAPPLGVTTAISHEYHHTSEALQLKGLDALYANGTFCLDVSKAETEVARFFSTKWPEYIRREINRLNIHVDKYDVHDGDYTRFSTDTDSIGNQASLVNGIEKLILPGNYKIVFEHGAMAPTVVTADRAQSAPEQIEHYVRHKAEIERTLTENLAQLKLLRNMLSEETTIIQALRDTLPTLEQLTARRKEAIWKSSKDAHAKVASRVSALLPRLKPTYGPIVRVLQRSIVLRNKVCDRELAAY